ncbi:MAG: PilN domain-containing protein [Pseudomonadota bacterium]
MIRINLLPHREIKRKARQQQIAILAGVACFLGVLVVWGVSSINSDNNDYQKRRNQFLIDQTAILDKQIFEIKDIKARMQELLARKQIVETLQNSRSDAVYLLDQVARLLPDGVYLRSIKQVGNDISLVGHAQSNAWISTLMRNLESSPHLESALLVEIKAISVNGIRQNEFNMKVKYKQTDTEE